MQVGRRNRNKYIEKNLCIMLVIYQESLHDARSTKCEILHSVADISLNMFLNNNNR